MPLWTTLGMSLAMATTPARAGADACGPGTAGGPRVLVLRGHRYRRIGRCHGVPVYITRSTDSTFDDRSVAGRPVVLVTRQSVDPASEDGGWPAPRGNLYLSLVVALPPNAARAALTAAVDAELTERAPGLVTTSGWDGDYGAHRGPDGRFLSGLLSGTRPEGTALGLDLHLGATPRDYDRLGAREDHVSLETLGHPGDPLRATLWSMLRRLPPPTHDTSGR
jgi:hypothetical protein